MTPIEDALSECVSLINKKQTAKSVVMMISDNATYNIVVEGKTDEIINMMSILIYDNPPFKMAIQKALELVNTNSISKKTNH